MTTRIAVAGAGLIGHRHADAIALADGVSLCAVVDPAPTGRKVADRHGVPCYSNLSKMFAAGVAEGVVLAVPNAAHGETALTCIDAGLPALVEKPFTPTVAAGESVLAAAAKAGVPLLTGHHRRYNPLIRKAMEIVQSGQLGVLTAVQAQAWVMKPDRYFDVAWRREPGGGPVYINFIHDIDLLHALCGPIVEVQAMESGFVRGNEVEETAVILLRFASGLLGTVNVSDAAAAPWSWELTARENAHYPATGQNCCWIAGTKGSLALPNVCVWKHEGPDGWWSPISSTKPIFSFEDPLVVQAAHFGAVIRGEAAPVVSGADGLAAVRVIEAVKTAARTGAPVRLD